MSALKNVESWIEVAFVQVLAKYPDLSKLVDDGKTQIAYNFPQLAKELLARIISPDVQLADEKDVKPEEKWIYTILSKLWRNLDFQLLAQGGHSIDTGAIALHALLLFLLQEIPHPATPLTENVEDLRSAVLELKRKCPGIDISSLVDDGKKAAEAMKNYELEIQKVSQEEISNLCRETFERYKKLIEPLTGGDGIDAIMADAASADEKAKIAKIIKQSAKLRDIVRLAGKLIPRALEKQESKADDGLHTVDGVERGDRLSRTLPADLGLARGHFLSFAKKFTEKTLSQFKMGRDKRKGGSIVILLDDTGSMSRKGRETWAKAVCWAVMAIAREQNRNLRLIHWGNGVNRCTDFPAGEYDLSRWIEDMQYFGNDRINQETVAFDSALDLIETDEFVSGADIVFITDGGWMDGGEPQKGWDAQVQERLDVTGTEVYSILIQCGKGHLPEFLLKNQIPVGDLANETDALDKLFESL